MSDLSTAERSPENPPSEDPRPGGPRAGDRRRVPPVLRTQVLAGLLVAVAVCLQQPAREFVYDAAAYWNGAVAVLQGGDVFQQGLLDLRGVATPFLYLPAALVVQLAGGSGAGFAVLVENALLIAAIGAWLLPRLVGIWRPVTPTVVWVSAAGSALLLRSFAPFPLTDLWGAALLLMAVVALRLRGWDQLLLAGLAAGFAFNVRPAALIPVAILAVAVLVARRVPGLWFPVGVALGLLPQIALNYWRGISWHPWPERIGWLTDFQAGYAAYVVRYDTVLMNDVPPSLFFCSPSMANALDGETPSSPGELVGTFVAHFPQGLVLSAQKIGASLHWGVSTPYYVAAPGVNGLAALLVTGTAVIGLAALLRATVRHGWRRLSLGHAAAIIAWVGSVLAVVSSVAESRFALPIVLIGIAGCALLAGGGVRMPTTRPGRLWLAAAVVALVAVLAVGSWGLQHPYAGGANLERCAAA